ncbi:hypothetical protein PCANC_04597 [Puccinia coronata f. sp. avenae]|uniref:Uncharacterized protein n=1 Tax=Puccinia coronata f. sp. avenae TaxID=200324 RepID=A0A2N5W0E7_9BASI|nr:hypothetical protein PCANC_16474 [Puccinia coronata f. sp. avenae]PLW52280.1 hypothetical protein PCASD_00050 [Puccinia coronata f. sp. avenae]PLW55723.1 hypothetical protein PCANC_04597 [Puccinia coronata f. sp. avenae]
MNLVFAAQKNKECVRDDGHIRKEFVRDTMSTHASGGAYPSDTDTGPQPQPQPSSPPPPSTRRQTTRAAVRSGWKLPLHRFSQRTTNPRARA